MAKEIKEKTLEERLRKTNLHHIYNFDIAGDGRFREVAVVKLAKTSDGKIQSVYYIDVTLMDKVDKGRMKLIVTGGHADKYELWDLMSQQTISNGKNALDYFHQLVRVEHGKGALVAGGLTGLAGVALEDTSIVGAGFTDPSAGSIETQAV